MRKWGELSQQEKSSRLTIGIVGFIIVFVIAGTITYLMQPKGYQAPKDTRPVFGTER